MHSGAMISAATRALVRKRTDVSVRRGAACAGRARAFGTKIGSRRIVLTGACGQVGAELLPHLRSIFGPDNVIGTDVREPSPMLLASGPFHQLDVTNALQLERLITEEKVGAIVHLAALLSATGEKNPMQALQVNNVGVTNVLEAARVHGLTVFSPSTIAVFGPSTPKHTPDETVMRPTTIYGVTKVHLELLGEYYHSKFGVDFRSLRYPGVVSSAAMPGGGTTDYAVEIYHEALAKGHYTCFLKVKDAHPPESARDAERVCRKERTPCMLPCARVVRGVSVGAPPASA